MRSWVVFNGFRNPDGMFLQVYVRATNADSARALAAPVYRFMADEGKLSTADLGAYGRFCDPALMTAIPTSEDPARGGDA